MKNNDKLASQILEEHEKEVGMKEIQERGYHSRTILHKAFKLKEAEFKKRIEDFFDTKLKQVKEHIELFGKDMNRDIDDREKFIIKSLPLVWKKELLTKLSDNHSQDEVNRETTTTPSGHLGTSKGCGKPFQQIFIKDAVYPDDYLICGFSKIGEEIQLCKSCKPSLMEKAMLEHGLTPKNHSQDLSSSHIGKGDTSDDRLLSPDTLSSKMTDVPSQNIGEFEWIHKKSIKEFIKRRLEKIDNLHKELTFGQSVKDCTHMKDVCPMWIIYRDFRDNAGRKLVE